MQEIAETEEAEGRQCETEFDLIVEKEFESVKGIDDGARRVTKFYSSRKGKKNGEGCLAEFYRARKELETCIVPFAAVMRHEQLALPAPSPHCSPNSTLLLITDSKFVERELNDSRSVSNCSQTDEDEDEDEGEEYKQTRKIVKSRSTNCGRRLIGRRIYDSELGQTCHWCRQKTVEDHIDCTRCDKNVRFCGPCLKNRHGEDIRLELQGVNTWVCPKCRGGCGEGCENCCNCGPCRKAQRLTPTGQLARAAWSVGFTNVHDFLVHCETGESAVAIALRKKGQGWTKSGEAGTVYKPPIRGKLERKYDSFSFVNRGSSDVHRANVPHRYQKLSIANRERGSSARRRLFDVDGDDIETEGKVSLGDSSTPSDDFCQGWKWVSKKKRNFVRRGINDIETGDEGSTWKYNNYTLPLSCLSSLETQRQDEDAGFVSQDHTMPTSHVGIFCQGADFRAQLNLITEAPFSLKQLKSLVEKVNYRKPLMRLRQTRYRSMHVESDRAGLSYLDHHPDLADKLSTAKEPEDKLKLLRGFFFWLQHSCMDGSFRPWATDELYCDAECQVVNGPDCQIIAEFVSIEGVGVREVAEDMKPQSKDLQTLCETAARKVLPVLNVMVKVEKGD